jgi:hypothetical protein
LADRADRRLPLVLYIGGTGRSGSTILERVLADRTGAFAGGELRYIWDRGYVEDQLCSCGSPFRSCAFWRDVTEAAWGDAGPPVDEALAVRADIDRVRHMAALRVPRLRRAAFAEGLAREAALLGPLYRAIALVSGTAVVIDSSKDSSYAYVLHATGQVRVALVHLVRDSRAVAYSWQRQRRRPEIHWEEAYMPLRPPVRVAAEWMMHNVALEVLAGSGVAAVRTRYEDFADRPDEEVDRIVQLLGDVDGTREPRPSHTVSGNPNRFERDRVRLVKDVAWAEAMRPIDRRLVTAITLPMLAAYGYLARPRRPVPPSPRTLPAPPAESA